MRVYEKFVSAISSVLHSIAALALFSIMLLISGDVFLRYVFNRPITGGYDIVTFLGSLIIALSFPRTVLDKVHVAMEFLTTKVSERVTRILALVNECLGILIFLGLAWTLFVFGNRLRLSGEAFPTLGWPNFYPAYVIGICCFMVCLVLFAQLVHTLKRRGEE